MKNDRRVGDELSSRRRHVVHQANTAFGIGQVDEGSAQEFDMAVTHLRSAFQKTLRFASDQIEAKFGSDIRAQGKARRRRPV